MKVREEIKTKDETESIQYRQPPHNTQAEQALLGAIITNNDAINRVGEYLRPEHFYEPVHQRIYDAILKFIDRGTIASPVTLKNHFDKDEALVDVGGAEYLVRLAGMSVAIINLEAYGKIIYDLAVRRNLIEIGADIVNDAYDENIERQAKDQIEAAEHKLFNLASEGTGESGFQALKVSLIEAINKADAAYKRTESLSGTSTGFIDLDSLLGGLANSDLLILAGRPSMGKTAFAINMAVNAAKYLLENHTDEETSAPSIGFFSLEMSSEQLAARMIAMESGVDSSKMRTGNLTDDEFARLVQGNKKLHKLPFFMDDTPALSISALRTRARRLKRKHNLGLLIVDYLQLLKGSAKSSEGNRVQEVSEITQGLKAVAKELNIPVIALSQLSRAVEQREDKRPQLSDLRESGSIEQDADIVMFIYREAYYEERKKPSDSETEKMSQWQAKMEACQNVTEIIIAKQRHGPIGTARLFFNANTTKFEDLAENYSASDSYVG
ncbi:MAG: replicative DNA helicase [Alphaproteobacteria bacterium CG11_big_fil_rev_8_21_14_0_20_39_49]|nr:MAG: replicative DNA helicase [Alphaproteobacteria bacterium CG11_big_fil_rev_8_21_14_0_20_39_49]